MLEIFICVKMIEVKQLIAVSIFLVVYCNSAPWSDDDNFNENDLKWHCKQLCTSNNGDPKYDSDTSTCYCGINSIKDSHADWKCLTNNARLLGLTLKIYESEKKIKRETNTETNTLTVADITTENTDLNLTTTDSTLLLPRFIKNIRTRLHLHNIRPLHVRRPILLGAANPENETDTKIPENIKELRRRIHERILELKNKRTSNQIIDNSSTTSSGISTSIQP